MDRSTYYALQKIKQVANSKAFKKAGAISNNGMSCCECMANRRTIDKRVSTDVINKLMMDKWKKDGLNKEVDYRWFNCSYLKYKLSLSSYGSVRRDKEILSCYSMNLVLLAIMLREEIK